MFLKHLTLIFGGLTFLFLSFAVVAMVAESRVWGQSWAGLLLLSLGGFGVSMAKDALSTGQIQGRFSVIHYANQPRLFWATVIFHVAAGVVLFITGLWALFFKN